MPKESWLDDCIVKALQREPLTRQQLMGRFGSPKSTMIYALNRLRERGRVRKCLDSTHNECKYEVCNGNQGAGK
jgi:hypothetical protein